MMTQRQSEIICHILDDAAGVNDWEYQFIEDIADEETLTTGQNKKLEEIAEKVGV